MAITLVLAIGLLSAPPTPVPLDRLLVSTDIGFFGVQEPSAWHGYTDDLAASYSVDVVFIKASESPGDHRVSIRVRLNDPHPKDIAADMAADMAEYRERFPGIAFATLAVGHPTYRTVAKLFSVPGRFAEYVAYVDPGPEFSYVFSVALSPSTTAATPAELEAFEVVLKSLVAVRSKGAG